MKVILGNHFYEMNSRSRDFRVMHVKGNPYFYMNINYKKYYFKDFCVGLKWKYVKMGDITLFQYDKDDDVFILPIGYKKESKIHSPTAHFAVLIRDEKLTYEWLDQQHGNLILPRLGYEGDTLEPFSEKYYESDRVIYDERGLVPTDISFLEDIIKTNYKVLKNGKYAKNLYDANKISISREAAKAGDFIITKQD